MITPGWTAPRGVVALCTTREDTERDMAAVIDIPDLRLPIIKQVHGARVARAETVTGGCEADAIVSGTPALGCRIETADCLPLLLTNRLGTEVAAVHAGWRGLAAGVIEAAVSAMRSPAAELLAWIGPAISQAHYEVGSDVYEALVTDPLDADSRACFRAAGRKYLADLPALARLRLGRAGVGAVSGGEFCTYADPAKFHSWRRDGAAAGRLVSVICLRPAATQSLT